MTESVKKYEPMFSAFRDETGKTPLPITNRIRSIEALMKRHDRIVWALRWERYEAAASSPAFSAQMKKFGSEISADQEQLNTYLLLVRDHFAHWFSLNSTKINAYVFDRQTPTELAKDFNALEDEWKTSRAQIINHSVYDQDEDDDDDDYGNDDTSRRKELEKKGLIEKVLDFGNGWAWWNLNRTYCTTEGGAMGHCGNAPSAQVGDEVLSLRHDMGNGNFRPSLTFILHKNGYVGEMKGRANEKPAARYHEMIVRLLMSDLVIGCEGGGYEASNNFSVRDLPQSVQDKILAAKPELFSLNDRMAVVIEDIEKKGEALPADKQLVIDSAKKKIKDAGFTCKRIDYSGKYPNIIIREWASRESYIKDEGRWNCLERLTKLFDKLSGDLLNARVVEDNYEAEDVVAEIRNLYFNTVFDDLLYYAQEADYDLEGVNIGVNDDGRVVVDLSLTDFLNPTPSNYNEIYDDEPPEPVLERIGTLDATGDVERSYDWSDIASNFSGDDIASAISKSVYEDKPLPYGVLSEMASAVTDKGTNYHSRDPNQMSLDLGDEAE